MNTIPEKWIRTQAGDLAALRHVTQIVKEDGFPSADVPFPPFRVKAVFPGVSFWQSEKQIVENVILLADDMAEDEADLLLRSLETWMTSESSVGAVFRVDRALEGINEFRRGGGGQGKGTQVDTHA